MIGLIVEGKSDVSKLNMVFKENIMYVVLNGINFRDEQKEKIKRALIKCDSVHILTDPDEAGEKVANKIMNFFPDLNRINVDPVEARVLKRRGYKYGVEYCSNNYLRSLLEPIVEENNE